MKKKQVVVIGPESSGSTYITNVLNDQVRGIHHYSLPYGGSHIFLDVEEFEGKYDKTVNEFFYVICTRDITISELSRDKRWPERSEKHPFHTIQAKEIIEYVIKNKKFLIWSYETFVYLKDTYVKILFDFLGLDFENIVRYNLNEISDENKKYIISSPKTKI
jgi:hypothetical protein